MDSTSPANQGLLQALIGDGRPLLIFTGLILVLAGGFALFLSATQQFLPHDIQYLGMTAEQLCGIQNCRVVHFMFHDRVSFGGSLIAIGALYLWLAEFPLKDRQPWAWWLFVVSGLAGFGSFLAYLGYGYLDSWHGAATLLLIPFYVVGLAKSYSTLTKPAKLASLCRPGGRFAWRTSFGIGRALLLATALGMIAGGATIMTVGMTRVFVPQDLTFIGISDIDIRAINPRLIPLIAHDRAGFGGAIATTGLVVLFSVWCGKPGKSLWQVLCFSGTIGFSTAIGVHPAVGYVDFMHLAPALLGALTFLAGLVLCYRRMIKAGPAN